MSNQSMALYSYLRYAQRFSAAVVSSTAGSSSSLLLLLAAASAAAAAAGCGLCCFSRCWAAGAESGSAGSSWDRENSTNFSKVSCCSHLSQACSSS